MASQRHHRTTRSSVDCQMVAIRKVERFLGGSSNGNKYTDSSSVTLNCDSDFWGLSVWMMADDDGSDQERTNRRRRRRFRPM